MVDEKFASAQIKRLTGLSFFPTEKEAVRELLMALPIAPTEKIAKSTVDYFLATVTECPKPAQIRERAQPPEEEGYQAPGPTRCNACGDTGFVRQVITRNGQEYDFAAPCGCKGLSV